MPQRTIRFSETTLQHIQASAKQRGFASAAAMVRHAVDQELTNGNGVEERIAATLDQIQSKLSQVQRVQQTLFAFVDTLARELLAGLPVQPSSSITVGRERYESFLKSAAGTMLDRSHTALSEHAIFRRRVLSTASRIISSAQFAKRVEAYSSQAVEDNKRKEFRLYPRRPRGRQPGSPVFWCSTYILLLHYSRLLRAKRRRKHGRRAALRPHNQRCAVRVMYARNATRGQWKAHGRYIARESATHGHGSQAGFDATEQNINIVARLEHWQAAGDERLWKLILSPEFGDRINLVQLTRDLMKRISEGLDTGLDWVAVSHFNTDNPHVHIALRGVRDDGKPLRLEREYVKHGIRSIAEDLCTRQIGYRSQTDVAQAYLREVSQQRFTSIDREIAKQRPTDSPAAHFLVRWNPAQPRAEYILARLRALQATGLAEAAGPDCWRVRQDFETALRAMQSLADRQKILAAHGVPVSDAQLESGGFVS
jgi:hypothetical protein